MSAADESPAPARAPLFDRLRGLLGLGPASIRDDIEDALAETRGEFSAEERQLLKNVLGLHDLRVADVMVPRGDIVAINIETRLGEVLRLFRTGGHSRLPVYAETLDDPRGMVHIRDFLDYLAGAAQSLSALSRERKENLAARAAGYTIGALDLSLPLGSAKILRPVLFVPPSMPALDLLKRMQATRTHMALVIDEYGGTDGLASIEDIVEMIVGDIVDEHDAEENPGIEEQPDGAFVADARASLEDATAATGVDFAAMSDAEDVDTLGGLISTIAGRVPTRGEIIATPQGAEFEVLDADPRRVKRVRIVKSGPKPPKRRPRGPEGGA